MKNNSNSKKQPRGFEEWTSPKLAALQEAWRQKQGTEEKLTIGLDLGDRQSNYGVLDQSGEVIGRGQVVTQSQPLEVWLGQMPPSRVVIEVGTHSPWVSRLVKQTGHEVVVANARRVKLISESSRKNDRVDAEMLARLGRVDVQLLSPIQHRSKQGQADLIGVRVRAELVELRTSAVNAVRGFVKSFGQRMPKCDAGVMNRSHAKEVDEAIRGEMELVLEVVEKLNEVIAKADGELKKVNAERYEKETAKLEQVTGVGTLTALTYVLTLEDAGRFRRSRDVGSYVGLRPKSSQSGERDPEMRISKEGDVYLRKLLVQCAQYILSKRGPDTDLKQWGLRIASKGKKKAKRRAVVAVARKLSVLLHRLWVSGEVYEPLRQRQRRQHSVAA